jgi:hypothetical protein
MNAQGQIEVVIYYYYFYLFEQEEKKKHVRVIEPLIYKSTKKKIQKLFKK